ncbi:endolytic transglycosylase MltG, partial [Patescibacteria group bacterium]|nr:endolytic transglycosylase MltG [Patescibacteria group bacterium]
VAECIDHLPRFQQHLHRIVVYDDVRLGGALAHRTDLHAETHTVVRLRHPGMPRHAVLLRSCHPSSGCSRVGATWAGVNRLRSGWKLDSDPTVQYALGTEGNWWPNPLSAFDLQFDSPYNTYLYAGLPPAPICNPSMDALRAVAQPAVSDYYFVRAKCDGSGLHNFSVTLEGHIQNECP